VTDPKRPGRSEPIRWAVYAVVGAALFWWSIRPFPIYASARLLILCFLGFALLWLMLGNRARIDALAVASILAVGLLAGTLSTPAWRTSLESAFVLMVSLVMFILISCIGLERRWLTVVVVGSASMLALATLVGFMEQVFTWHGVIGEVAPSSTFWERLPVTLPRVGVGALHPNETAMIAALSIPMALVGRRRFPEFRHFWTLAAIVLVAMLVVTGSRAGAIAGLFAGLLTLWTLRGSDSRSRRRWVLAGGVAVLAVVFGALIVVFTDYRPDFLFRGTVVARQPIWSAGWDMFLDAPVLGNGAGSFSWLADTYLGSTYPGAEARRIWNEAHNGYIQLLSEFGIVGAAALVGALWLVARRSRALMRGAGFARDYAVAVIAALAGLAFHSIFDSLTAGLAPVIFLSALVGGLYTAGTPSTRSQGRWPSLIWAIALVVPAVVFAALSIGPHFAYQRGVAAAVADDWSGAIQHLNDAASSDSLPVYERAASVAEAWAGAPNAARLEGASELEPFDSAAFLNRVAVADPDSRGALLDSEHDRLRSEEVIQITVGELEASLNEDATALELYAAALSANPWLVASDVWTQALPDVEARSGLIQQGLELDPCGITDIFYVEGIDVVPFEETIASSCPATHPAGLALRLAQGETEAVHSAAVDGLESVPEDIRLRRIAALSSATIDLEESRRHLAVGALLGDPWSALTLAIAYDSDELPPSVGGLLRSRILGYSPVVVLNQETELYWYAGIRSRIVDRRPETLSTLLNGQWRFAATRLHREILEVLGA